MYELSLQDLIESFSLPIDYYHQSLNYSFLQPITKKLEYPEFPFKNKHSDEIYYETTKNDMTAIEIPKFKLNSHIFHNCILLDSLFAALDEYLYLKWKTYKPSKITYVNKIAKSLRLSSDFKDFSQRTFIWRTCTSNGANKRTENDKRFANEFSNIEKFLNPSDIIKANNGTFLQYLFFLYEFNQLSHWIDSLYFSYHRRTILLYPIFFSQLYPSIAISSFQIYDPIAYIKHIHLSSESLEDDTQPESTFKENTQFIINSWKKTWINYFWKNDISFSNVDTFLDNIATIIQFKIFDFLYMINEPLNEIWNYLVTPVDHDKKKKNLNYLAIMANYRNRTFQMWRDLEEGSFTKEDLIKIIISKDNREELISNPFLNFLLQDQNLSEEEKNNLKSPYIKFVSNNKLGCPLWIFYMEIDTIEMIFKNAYISSSIENAKPKYKDESFKNLLDLYIHVFDNKEDKENSIKIRNLLLEVLPFLENRNSFSIQKRAKKNISYNGKDITILGYVNKCSIDTWKNLFNACCHYAIISDSPTKHSQNYQEKYCATCTGQDSSKCFNNFIKALNESFKSLEKDST